MKFMPDVAEGANDSPWSVTVQHFPSLMWARAVLSQPQSAVTLQDAGRYSTPSTGLCPLTALTGHSGELFSEGRISAPTLCLWGATPVASSFSLSTNVLKIRICGGWRGGGGGEFWSPGEIKFSFSVDIRLIRLSVKPPIWKWMYYVLTLFLVLLVEEKEV